MKSASLKNSKWDVKERYDLAAAFYEEGRQIESYHLVGTKFEGQNPATVKIEALIPELFRSIIKEGSKNFSKNEEHVNNAMVALGACISKGTPVECDDLNACSASANPLEMSPLAVELELYRTVLSHNPDHLMARYSLALCLEVEGKIKAQDLLHIPKSDLSSQCRVDLIAEIYRKIIQTNPRFSDAYCRLAMCIEKGARLNASELRFVSEEDNKTGVAMEVVSSRLYMQAIIFNPEDYISIYKLANLMLKGNKIFELALPLALKTLGIPEDEKRDQQVIELYKKALSINPNCRVALSRLVNIERHNCIIPNLDTNLCQKMTNFALSHAKVCLADKLCDNEVDAISKEDLKGTDIKPESLRGIKKNELRASIYREAIRLDPDNTCAIVGLGNCIEQGNVSLYLRDFVDTPFEGQDLIAAESQALAAALYRKVLAMEPNHSKALFYLGNCLGNGVPLESCDLNGSEFSLLSGVNLSHLEAEFYRRAIGCDPMHAPAFYCLAMCIIQDPSCVRTVDLVDTKYKDQKPSEVNKYGLAAELFRKAIYMMPTFGRAIRQLAMCIKQDIAIEASDLDLSDKLWYQIPKTQEARSEFIVDLFLKAMSVDPKECEWVQKNAQVVKSKKSCVDDKPPALYCPSFESKTSPSNKPSVANNLKSPKLAYKKTRRGSLMSFLPLS